MGNILDQLFRQANGLDKNDNIIKKTDDVAPPLAQNFDSAVREKVAAYKETKAQPKYKLEGYSSAKAYAKPGDLGNGVCYKGYGRFEFYDAKGNKYGLAAQ